VTQYFMKRHNTICTKKQTSNQFNLLHETVTEKNKVQSEKAHFDPGAATWQASRNIRVVFDSGLFLHLYGNMASSRKPEVRNVSHCRHRRTEPRPQITCTEKLVKRERVVFETCEWTDKQTDRQTDRYADRNTLHPTGGKVNMMREMR